jgi:hypothetical protein
LAHAFLLWGYSYKRLKLAQLLGQLGVFLTKVDIYVALVYTLNLVSLAVLHSDTDRAAVLKLGARLE